MALCPSCGKKSLDPILKSRPYLVIKESFTQIEIDKGVPFTLTGKNKYGRDENTNSYYLQKEMGMVGINFQLLSLTALWTHAPPKAGRTKESKETLQKCLDWSISQVIKCAENKKIIILMGAEVTRIFTGYSVKEISGLICRSDLLPWVPVVISAPNPDNLMRVPIGELRNSLKVFSEQIKIHEQWEKA